MLARPSATLWPLYFFWAMIGLSLSLLVFLIELGYPPEFSIAVATPVMGIGFAVTATAIRSKRLAIIFWAMTAVSILTLLVGSIRLNYVQIPSVQLPQFSIQTLQFGAYSLGFVYYALALTWLVMEVRGRRSPHVSTSQQVAPRDSVAIAQAWVYERLKPLKVKSWSSKPAKTRADGSIVVTGSVKTYTQSPDFEIPHQHVSVVMMTRDQQIRPDESWVENVGKTI